MPPVILELRSDDLLDRIPRHPKRPNITILAAYPHSRGPGKVHWVQKGTSTTYCGRTPHGETRKGWESEVTCQICLNWSPR